MAFEPKGGRRRISKRSAKKEKKEATINVEETASSEENKNG